MSRYLEILSVSRPFFIGTDTNDRVLLSCNYQCMAAQPVDKFEEEIGRLLFDASLGTFNTDMFVGSMSTLPTGNGPYVNIIDTGGVSPLETHDGSKYERMSFQIIVRAKDRRAARTRALAIWRLLDGQREVTVVAA